MLPTVLAAKRATSAIARSDTCGCEPTIRVAAAHRPATKRRGRRCRRRWAAVTGGRVLADLACPIADEARVIGDQRELFGPVASVPTDVAGAEEGRWRRDWRWRKITAAVNEARHHAWAQVTARHGRCSQCGWRTGRWRT
jgi:hypothetical protein